MNQNGEYTKADFKALKEILSTGILRMHQQWQDELAALIASPYGDNENVFDRNMEITKHSHDFFKVAMEMESCYRRSCIHIGIMNLLHDGYLNDSDLNTLSPELKDLFRKY